MNDVTALSVRMQTDYEAKLTEANQKISDANQQAQTANIHAERLKTEARDAYQQLDLANRHAAEISEDADKQLKDKEETIRILRREMAEMKYRESTVMKPLGTYEEKCEVTRGGGRRASQETRALVSSAHSTFSSS